MKRILLATSILTMASTAMAADLGNGRGGLKDGPVAYVEDGRNPFAGFNVGIHGGGTFTNLDIMDQFDGIGSDGFDGGIHGGYNFCPGRICVGAYVEGSLSNVNSEIAGFDLLTMDSREQIGLLVGYVVGSSTLISGHAGYEWQQWSSDLISGDIDATAFVIGGSMDTMLRDHLSIGVKVDYLMLDSAEVSGIGDVTKFVDESEGFRAVARLTYRH